MRLAVIIWLVVHQFVYKTGKNWHLNCLVRYFSIKIIANVSKHGHLCCCALTLKPLFQGCSSPLVVKFADTQREKEQRKAQQLNQNSWNTTGFGVGTLGPQYLAVSIYALWDLSTWESADTVRVTAFTSCNDMRRKWLKIHNLNTLN